MLLQNFVLNLKVKIWCYTAMALQSLDAPTLLLKYKKMMGNYLLLRWGNLGSWCPNTTVCLFPEILGMICDSFENKDEIITSTFINIKNLRSDRCAVRKKCNDLFIQFRKNISKNARKNFSGFVFGSYSLEQPEKLTNVNQFFCSLHYFVHYV